MFNIQDRLTSFAMLGATWIMWLLILLSVVAVAIILERAYFFFSTKDDLGKLRDALRDKLKSSDLAGAESLLKASPSVEAEVVRAGLAQAEDGAASAEERMDGQAQLSRLAMERNLAFLGTVGNNAPFVGLLGTVIGIIRSFAALNASQGQVSPNLMADIGESLVATAIGLLVALPAVAFYNLFQRTIRTRVVRAEALGKDLLAHLKSQRVHPAKAAE